MCVDGNEQALNGDLETEDYGGCCKEKVEFFGGKISTKKRGGK